MTIDELSERLALPRTTIFYWVRDLPIERVWSSSAQRAATLAMQEKYRRLREEAYLTGCASFDALAADPLFRDFVCLCLAEGSKRQRNVVQICNSDPAVMKLAAHWLRQLTPKRLNCSIQYHADQDLDELRRFWGSELEVEPNSIKLQRKSNSNQLTKRTWRSRYGVLSIAVNDTLLRARVEGWLDCLRASWV